MSENPYRVPAFCPLCKRMMVGRKSVSTYYDYKCCRDCWVEWVDAREERWASGWRPTEEEVAAFCKKLEYIYSSSP